MVRDRQEVRVTDTVAQRQMVLEMRSPIVREAGKQQWRDQGVGQRIVDLAIAPQVAMTRVMQDVAEGALTIGNQAERQRRKPTAQPDDGTDAGKDGQPVEGDVGERACQVQAHEVAVRATMNAQLRSEFSNVRQDCRMQHHSASSFAPRRLAGPSPGQKVSGAMAGPTAFRNFAGPATLLNHRAGRGAVTVPFAARRFPSRAGFTPKVNVHNVLHGQ